MRARSIRTGRHALGAIAGGLALTLVLAACGSSPSSKPQPSAVSHAPAIPAGPIKLGALFTLSGPFAPIGTALQTIDQVLIGRLNAAGGIAGHQVTLVSYNDQGNPTIAVQKAEELVSDGVSAVIYAGTAATDQQTVPVFMKAKIPVVMLAPSDRWANGAKWPYFFDVYPLNGPTMTKLVAFAKAKGVTKLGVVSDGSTFASTLASVLVPDAKAAGLPIVKAVTISPTAVDVNTQMTQLKSAGVNGIALLAEAGLGTVYDSLRSIGWTPPIVTTAAAYVVGYSALGPLATTTFSNCGVALRHGQALNSSLTSVMKAVTAKTGVQPNDTSAIYDNDGLLILKYAIQKAKSLSGPAIAQAIESIHDQSFTSPLFAYSFSASNHGGWPAAQVHVCDMAPLGPYGIPYIASAP